MTLEEYIKHINGEMGENHSLSERTVRTYMENVMLEEGNEPDAEYFKKHANILKALNGQYNHDFAEFKKTTAKQTSKSNDTAKEDGGNGGDDRLEIIHNSIKEIIEWKNRMESERETEIKRKKKEGIVNSLLEKKKELKVSYDNEWEDAVKGTDIEGLEEKDALDKVKKEFERLVKRYHGGNASPFGGSRKGGETNIEGGMDDPDAKKLRENYLKTLDQQ